MCRAGGRRCKNSSLYNHSLYKLKDRIRYYKKTGQDDKVVELEAAAANLEEAHQRYGGEVSPFELPVSSDVDDLVSHLEAHGMDPMVVGGTIRDAYSGTEPKDIDIEVYGTKVDSLIGSLKKKYKVNTVGKSFGVIKVVLPNGEDIDISLPRKDNKIGDGHKGFVVDTDSDITMQEATERRDYTINSMMWSPHTHALVDLHGGATDMKNKTLRHVSEAFSEDPLRVLRGFQFASRMGFHMAPETASLAQDIKPTYNDLAKERVVGEWEKFYRKGVYPAQGLKALNDTQWDEHFSGLRKINTEEFRANLDQQVGKMKFDSGDHRVRILSSAIARQMDQKDGSSFVKQTVLTDKAQSHSRFLAYSRPEEESDAAIKHFSNSASKLGLRVKDWHMSMQLSPDAKEREYANSIAVKAKKLGVYEKEEEPLVTGKLIMSTGDRKPGRWMSVMIDDALDAQYKGEIRTVADAQKWIQDHS